MNVTEKKIIEAMLFLADEPIPAGLMGEVLEVPTQAVEAHLEELAASYEAEDRGFVLRQAAGGWRLYTSPDCAPWLERFVLSQRHSRLTGASLEVLAIVAYKGPISRVQISEIRGVDSDGVVRTLQQRGLLVASGREAGPGAPVLFTVSDEFLEKMGLNAVADLPPLTDFMPDAEAVEEMESRLSPDV